MSTEPLKPTRDILFIAYVLRTIWFLKRGKDRCPTIHEFVELAKRANQAIVQGRSNQVQAQYLDAVFLWHLCEADQADPAIEETQKTFQEFAELLNRLLAEQFSTSPFLESHVPGLVLLDALFKGKIFREYIQGWATILLKELGLECPGRSHDDINTAWAHVIANGVDSSSAITAEEFFQP
jgi:hypothetical protein